MDNGELSGCESPLSDHRKEDVVLREVIISGKRKFMDSANTVDDVDGGSGESLSPRKLQIAQHHNNNDVSFVLIHQESQQSINEDLQNNNDEVFGRASLTYL